MTVALDNTESLVAQARSLLAGERDRVANAANLSALINDSLDGLNWVGVYFFDGNELVVGPFQGKPACVRIPLGRGVCGRSAQSREILRIADVDEFEDHIVCDAASKSEIVLPLVRNDELVGVLDIDSPLPARFTPEDEKMLGEIAEIYVESID